MILITRLLVESELWSQQLLTLQISQMMIYIAWVIWCALLRSRTLEICKVLLIACWPLAHMLNVISLNAFVSYCRLFDDTHLPLFYHLMFIITLLNFSSSYRLLRNNYDSIALTDLLHPTHLFLSVFNIDHYFFSYGRSSWFLRTEIFYIKTLRYYIARIKDFQWTVMISACF